MTVSVSTSDPSQQDLLSLANALADLARPVALRYFRQPLVVESKADDSPVTIADRTIEELLRRHVAGRFPAHGILGEEFGSEHLGSEYVWAIDPIDGTRSFVSGMPTFGTLIALLHDQRPVLGIVDMPALDERWVGMAGQPSTFKGRACRTRPGVDLSAAILYSTTPDQFVGDDLSRYIALSDKAGMCRFGGDCYAYGLLASGWIDGVVEASLQPYDYLSMVPIIEGAGGVISDWEGRPLGMQSGSRVAAAATPELHAQMLRALGA